MKFFILFVTFIKFKYLDLLDDQPGQYWIYANSDNELATAHLKVDS